MAILHGAQNAPLAGALLSSCKCLGAKRSFAKEPVKRGISVFKRTWGRSAQESRHIRNVRSPRGGCPAVHSHRRSVESDLILRPLRVLRGACRFRADPPPHRSGQTTVRRGTRGRAGARTLPGERGSGQAPVALTAEASRAMAAPIIPMRPMPQVNPAINTGVERSHCLRPNRGAK